MREAREKIIMWRRTGRRTGARLALGGAGILAAVFLLAGCGDRKVQPGAAVLAKVGDRDITEAEFKWELERRRNAGLAQADKSVVLDELVRHEALLQKARSAGIEADPQVRREISNLLIGRLMEKELRPKLEAITVSDDEIKAAYERRKAAFTRAAQARLAVITLAFDPKATEARKAETRQRMDEARRRVLADPPRGRGPAQNGFGALAIDFSDDQAGRYRGGDIGWIEAQRLPPRWPREVMEAGLALSLGQVSGVIASTNGVYLVTKTDSREAVVAPLAEVEASIRQHLVSRKRQDMEAAYRNDSTRLISVTINTNALAALAVPAAGTAGANEKRKPLFPGNSENEVQP